jgi:hypothetical protein
VAKANETVIQYNDDCLKVLVVKIIDFKTTEIALIGHESDETPLWLVNTACFTVIGYQKIDIVLIGHAHTNGWMPCVTIRRNSDALQRLADTVFDFNNDWLPAGKHRSDWSIVEGLALFKQKKQWRSTMIGWHSFDVNYDWLPAGKHRSDWSYGWMPCFVLLYRCPTYSPCPV